MRAYIPDGYTESAYIAAVDRLHEAVEFKYRPVLPEAVRALMHGFFSKPAEAQGKIVDQTLIRQLDSWDLKDHEGNDLDISVEVLSRIKKPLKDRLFNIITCYETDDTKGGETPQGDSGELDFDKLLKGEPQPTPQESDSKN